MSETKLKIIKQALHLFNNNGTSNVSLRAIAKETGISIGNLQYHFKKREDIIEALYFQLVDKIDAIIFIPDHNLLASFFSISKKMFEILYDYHFFLLDFVTITRNNKTIKKHYSELSKRREMEFLFIVGVFIENGIFRKEVLKNEYRNLFKRTEIISNFSFSSIMIEENKITKKAIDEYATLISQSIYIYLTDEAKKQYESLFPSQKNN